MKKSLSLLVAIAMVVSMFATLVSANTETAGQYLNKIGVIKGTGNDLLEGENWKRQDVAVIISRLLDKEAEAQATANTHEFTDVRGDFYDGYISWAKNEKIMEGNGNGTFGFDASITNQQFAAVVLRALKVDTTGDNYANVPELAVKAGLLAEDTNWSAAAVRGTTYDVIVKALNTEIEGKKLGTILGLPGFEITELAIAKAGAVVKSSVNVEFNTAVATLKSEDVTVTDADGNVVLVEKVTVDGNKATVTLSESLQSNKTYTVKVAAATSTEGFEGKDLSAEFKFEATKATTLEFVATTIAFDAEKEDELKVVAKDANGNNVTANYDSSDFSVKSNDESVIDGFDAKKVGEAIVNVVLTVGDDETIETGNQIITVKGALSASITKVSAEGNIGDEDLKVFNTNDEDRQIKFEAEDQAGNKYEFNELVADREDVKDVTFKSLNPTRLVVDEKEGTYRTLQTGSATVQISAKVQGVTVSKSVVITIEEAPAFKGIEVSSSSVKLVEGSDLEYSFEVKTVDQYGETIEVNPDKVDDYTVVSNKTDLVDVATVASFSEGKSKVVLDGKKNGSASIKVTFKYDGKTYTKSVSASQVAQNGFGGYNADLNASKINVTPNNDKAKDIKKAATLTVYLKDKNGNNYAYADHANLTIEADGKGEVLVTETANAGEYNVEATKAGDVTLTIKAGPANNAVKVATVKVEVIDSNPTISKVVQAKSTITVKDTATKAEFLAALFGKNSALVVTDQHGDEVKAEDINVGLDGDATIAPANQAVIGADGSVNGAGKTSITVSINKQFFVINVVVND